MTIKIVDRRSLGKVPYRGSERRAYKKRRKLSTIVALGCHHTANLHSPLRGLTLQQRIESAIERSGRTPYHIEVFRDLVILSYAWDLVTWHGGLLNYPTIGLAVGGLFAEHQADFDPEKHDDPQEFEEAIAACLSYIDEVRIDRATSDDLLPNLKLIRTHSQTTTKPSDPGEGVTQLLCTYGAMLKLPLIGDKDYKAGRGQLWHSEWSQIIELSKPEEPSKETPQIPCP